MRDNTKLQMMVTTFVGSYASSTSAGAEPPGDGGASGGGDASRIGIISAERKVRCDCIAVQGKIVGGAGARGARADV